MSRLRTLRILSICCCVSPWRKCSLSGTPSLRRKSRRQRFWLRKPMFVTARSLAVFGKHAKLCFGHAQVAFHRRLIVAIANGRVTLSWRSKIGHDSCVRPYRSLTAIRQAKSPMRPALYRTDFRTRAQLC
jgi:hypothetical protein